MMKQKQTDSVSELFTRCLESFNETCRTSGAAETRCYHIGPLDVEIHLAHPGMQVFVKALAHLQGPPRQADPLKIHMWDSASFSHGKPPLPQLKRTAGTPVELFRRRGRDTAFTWLFWKENLSFEAMNTAENQALFWTEDCRRPAYSDCGAPLFGLLSGWLRNQGLMIAHAGAVGLNGRGVLIAGTGGSGKTTACLKALAAGMDYLGEDHTLLGGTENLRAYSLYSCAKIKPGPVPRPVPFIESDVQQFDHWRGEKELIYLYPGFRRQLAPALEIDGIVFPQITAADTPAFRKISAAEALRRLAPSTVLQLQNPGAEDLTRLASLVSRRPAWVLETGCDTDAMCRMLRGIIEKGGRI